MSEDKKFNPIRLAIDSILLIAGLIILGVLLVPKASAIISINEGVKKLEAKGEYLVKVEVIAGGETSYYLETTTPTGSYTEFPKYEGEKFNLSTDTEIDSDRYGLSDWIKDGVLYLESEGSWIEMPQTYSTKMSQRSILNIGILSMRGQIKKRSLEDGSTVYTAKISEQDVSNQISYEALGYLEELKAQATKDGDDSMYKTLDGLEKANEVDLGIKRATLEIKLNPDGVLVGSRLALDTKGGVLEYVREVRLSDIKVRETPDLTKSETYYNMMKPLSEFMEGYDDYEEGMGVLSELEEE